MRERSDDNALLAAEVPVDSKITLHRVLWRIPQITLSDKEKLRMLQIVERDTPIPIQFRQWELHEYPVLPTTNKHSWPVKSSRIAQQPRYVIFGLQTDRKMKSSKDSSQFDHCALRNIRLYLNGTTHPYENMDVDFSKNKFAVLYAMFCQFQTSYFQKEPHPLFTPEEYKNKTPLAVIDCTYHDESIKQSVVDIRLEFETHDNIPEHTTAYCLIIHDVAMKYHPLSNLVNRV